MKFMISLCCFAAVTSSALAGWAGPPAHIALTADGRNVLDTPEVAHARAAHLAALAQASAHSGPDNGHGEDDGSYDPRWDNEDTWQQAGGPAHYNAAPAPAWNPNPAWNAAPHYSAGPAPVADTPEVAQAKAAHFAAVAAAKSSASDWNPAPQWHSAPAAPAWHSAPAPIRLSHDGTQVLDTPEVAAARAAHFAAHATAAPAHYSAPAPAYFAPAANKWNGAPSWHAAPAQIRLSHDGSQVLETPEVAAARAAHLAAHAAAAANSHSAPSSKW